MNSGSELPLLFSRTFKGVVWGTFTVPECSLLIVEVRNTDTFEARFSAWNYKAGKWIWEEKMLEEHWWVTPVGSAEGVILFQTYRHGANPDLKGLVAVDAVTMRQLWKHDSFAFHDIRNAAVLGYLLTGERLQHSIDIRSGAVNEGFTEGLPPDDPSDLKVPVSYYEDSENFGTCRAFLEPHLHQIPVGVIEYLEQEDKILMGCYVKESESLANYLLVFSGEGGKILCERLGEGLGKDTFFVLAGCLIFVKNKSELYSYRIT